MNERVYVIAGFATFTHMCYKLSTLYTSYMPSLLKRGCRKQDVVACKKNNQNASHSCPTLFDASLTFFPSRVFLHTLNLNLDCSVPRFNQKDVATLIFGDFLPPTSRELSASTPALLELRATYKVSE